MKWVLRIISLMAFVGLCLLVPVLLSELPDKYKPWAPLSMEDAPNFLTEYKLSRFQDNRSACTSFLGRGGIEYTAIADQDAPDFCEKKNRVTLDQSLYPYSARVTANCALTAAIALWEKHVVKPSAEKHLAGNISSISHYGIYSCRRVNNSASGRPSQHASSNAIDIAGFTLDNGRRITLIRDWGKDSDAGRFLKDIRDGSCGIFKGVLGPDYNTAHRDHFHLDLGPYNICR